MSEFLFKFNGGCLILIKSEFEGSVTVEGCVSSPIFTVPGF